MKLCPYCKKPLEKALFYCPHCNKPLIVNLEKKFNGIFREPNNEISFYSSDSQSEVESFNFSEIKNEEIEHRIQEIDKKLEQKEEIGESMGPLLLEKSSLYYSKRDLNTALKILEIALTNFSEEDDMLNNAICQNEMGLIQEDLGFFDEAIYRFEKALEILEKIGDNNKVIQVSNNLGNVFFLVKDLDNSYNYYEKALKLAKQEKMLFEEIKSSSNLVEILFLWKDYDQTTKILEKNLEFFKKNNDTYGIINSLVKLGKLNYYLGEGYFDQSYENLKEALELIDAASESLTIYVKAQLEWECFLYMGKLHLLWNNDKEAENYLLKSLEAIRIFEIREDVKQGIVLEALGELYEFKGENERAIEYYNLSSEIYYKFGDGFKTAEISTKIAQIYLDFLEDDIKAIENFENALQTLEKLNYPKESAQILHKLGDIAVKQGEIDLAISNFEKAKTYYEIIKDDFNVNLLIEKIKKIMK